MANIDFTNRKTFLKFETGNRPRRKARGAGIVLVAGACIVVFLAAFVPVALSGSGSGGGRPEARNPAGAETAYRLTLDRLERERAGLAGKLAAAPGVRARRAALREASADFSAAVVHGIIPFWYGTGYDFNGATAVPGVGGISCGHFVTTVLRDAGLKIDRIALAQLPSETLIRTLVPEESILRYSNVSGEAFLDACRGLAPGLYVLGLDKHVGFLVIDSAGASFIHSTLLPPYSVVREPAASSRALMRSAYRVLGNLSGDKSFLLKWLGKEAVITPRGDG